MGGLVGAALVYANYYHAIDIFEGGRGVRTLATAGLFSTYAVRAHYQTIFAVSNEIFASWTICRIFHVSFRR